jgi:predicted acylesterase/phospholipase RssA
MFGRTTLDGCYSPGKPDTITATLPAQGVPRARLTFDPGDADRPDIFVGLAISGGGSRAAVFGMAVMKELDELGILRHVSAISTTSGGGLAGAYYSLHARDMDWAKAQDAMAVDYLGKWLRSNAGPRQLVRVVATDEDRSDLMADVFDAEIFRGKTYSELGPFAPGSAPIWLANATQIGDTRRFTFSEHEFNQLRSSLSSFPLSQAVMASAAFPGVFNSVTVRNYTPAFVRDGKFVYDSGIKYRHLIDGGPTDNLGIEALLELAKSHDRAKWGPLGAGDSGPRQGTCMLLIVDAYPRGVPSRYDSKQDLRGTFGRLVDSNFFDALDALLISRRADLLGYLGLEDSHAFGRRSASQFVYFDVPNFGSQLGRATRVEDPDRLYPEGGDPTPPTQIANKVPIRERSMRCAAWHLNLSGLEAIQNYIQTEGEDSPHSERADDALSEQRALHQSLVAQIATNFRLTGPEGCPATLLDKALRESATVLVREDWRSQSAACDWLRSNGLQVSGDCGRYVPPTSIQRMPLRGVVIPARQSPTGPADETILCGRANSQLN